MQIWISLKGQFLYLYKYVCITSMYNEKKTKNKWAFWWQRNPQKFPENKHIVQHKTTEFLTQKQTIFLKAYVIEELLIWPELAAVWILQHFRNKGAELTTISRGYYIFTNGKSLTNLSFNKQTKILLTQDGKRQ